MIYYRKLIAGMEELQMAKRFTDSEKWEDAWFQELESKHKLFWFYLLDKCDHAGVWKVNFRTASFFTDSNLEYEETIQVFKLRITEISNEYWLINKFVKYQYNKEIGELNVNNKVHLSVLNKLNNFIQFKPLVSPLLGIKDKDKDKAIDKDKDKPTDKDIVIYKDDNTIESKWYDWFCESWVLNSLEHRKKKSYLRSLTKSAQDSLKVILKDFTKDDVRKAIVGLMVQRSFPNQQEFANDPTHLLKDDGVFIGKYLGAFESKDREIYGKLKKFE